MLSREANGRIRAGQPWSPQLGCINNEDGSVGGYSRECGKSLSSVPRQTLDTGVLQNKQPHQSMKPPTGPADTPQLTALTANRFYEEV